LIAIENIGRNVVNMNLTGATVNAREQMPDGTWYVRVTVRKANAMRQVNAIVNNEVADFAEFRAAQAIQRLDFEVNRAQPNPSAFVVND
jgi:(2Fe-2S) ferredoxin